MPQIYIEPSTQTVTNIVTSFVVTVTSVVLFTSASLSVDLYNADPALIKTVYLTLSGEDYSNWSNDDDYINQYVATQLGFVITNSPPTPDPVPPEPVPPDPVPVDPSLNIIDGV